MYLINDKAFFDARVQREARALVNNGFEVSLITLAAKEIDGIEYLGGAKLYKLKLLSRPLPKNTAFWAIKYLEFFIRAARISLKLRPHWVHCNDLPALPIGAFIKKRMHSILVYDSREIWLGRKMGRVTRLIWSGVEKRLIRKVDHVILTDEFRSQWFEKKYGLPKVDVVMNIPEVAAQRAVRSLRDDLGISEDSLIGVYFGDMHPGRFLDRIIESVDLIPDHIHFAFVGPLRGEFRDYLLRVHSGSRSPNRVHIVGPLPPGELIPYVSQANFSFVFYEKTSLNNYLCSPNKLFESLQAGLPILCGDNPLLKRVVTEENAGITIIGEISPQKIAQGVKEILSCDLKKLRSNCQEASAKYTWDTEEKNLLNVYKRNSLVNA